MQDMQSQFDFCYYYRYKAMYASFDDIFLKPAQLPIIWDDVIITTEGKFIKLTKRILEKIIAHPQSCKHLYRVLMPNHTHAYAYMYIRINTHYIQTYAGIDILPIQEFMERKFNHPDMWICDIACASGIHHTRFNELRSGINDDKAVECRTDVLNALLLLMLTYDADVATNGSLPCIHDRTGEWLDKLGEHEQYGIYKQLYARMRAKLIIYLRRLMARDTARMIVAMAYPWH